MLVSQWRRVRNLFMQNDLSISCNLSGNCDFNYIVLVLCIVQLCQKKVALVLESLENKYLLFMKEFSQNCSTRINFTIKNIKSVQQKYKIN